MKHQIMTKIKYDKIKKILRTLKQIFIDWDETLNTKQKHIQHIRKILNTRNKLI